MARAFHIGDVLSITTGQLLSPSGMSGVYEILNYMTGDSLFTHQLIRAQEVCQPVLRAQHPELAGVDASSVTPDNWGRWLDEQVARYGEQHLVVPLTEWESKDPIQELVDMGVAPDKIIPVKL